MTIQPSPMAFAASIAQKTSELQRAMPASDVAALAGSDGSPPSPANGSPTRMKAKDRLIRALFKGAGGGSKMHTPNDVVPLDSSASTSSPGAAGSGGGGNGGHGGSSPSKALALAASLFSVTATSSDNADAKTDRWSMILQRARETGQIKKRNSVEIAAAMTSQWEDEDNAADTPSSLKQVLRSKKVKDFIKNAVLVKKFHQSSAPRSIVMEQWVKTSMLRNQKLQMREIELGVSDPDSDFTAANGEDVGSASGGSRNGSSRDVSSAFEVNSLQKKSQMHGRTLLLEESCRRAFALRGENRSQLDLQALKAWFQMSKLKITTDFERLQPDELDLLCRRMILINCHAHEVLFRQGDEGDALYIVFSGIVEVRVSQRVRGEKVEVTVCELSKGDFFGERSLLFNEARAATIVMKTPSELVRITREDYNIMLKKDQLEFLHRMHTSSGGAGGAGGGLGAQNNATVEYFRILAKKRGTRTKADIDCLKEYVQTLKFFRGLPKTFVRELCGIVEFLMLPANTVVFREGEIGDLFYIILSGSVDINVNAKDFKGNLQQTKLINLTEGSHFGELALMKNHGVRSATVVTKEDCQFLTIVGEDYNATLRRMQKDDLTRRIGILDKIPMFQTPEWTADLLKEMSYVLMEQKLATGTVLFKQGEKALSVFFVMRGELVATKDITDPGSNKSHTVFLERLGQYRVVGEEAAAGSHFNEVFYRDLTVTSSTPVEVLILSKYDVFHRLSRAARETLRSSANVRTESIVYLDRYYKTMKWQEYKQKVLNETLNTTRLSKILPKPPAPVACASTCTGSRSNAKPNTSTSSSNTNNNQSPTTINKSNLVSAGSSCSPPRTASITPLTAPPSTPATSCCSVIPGHGNLHQLVQANEFLLVSPRDKSIAKCFPTQDGNLSQYVLSLNTDAPSDATSAGTSKSPMDDQHRVRAARFQKALDAEEERHEAIMREGNPFAYLDIPQMASSLLLDDPNHRRSSINSFAFASMCLPNAVLELNEDSRAMLDQPSVVQFSTSQMMNQFFQDNFIYSLPPSKRRVMAKEQEEATREEERLELLRQVEKEKLLAKRKEAILTGDLVLIEFKFASDDDGPESSQDQQHQQQQQPRGNNSKRKPNQDQDDDDSDSEAAVSDAAKPAMVWAFRIIQSVTNLEEAQRLLMQGAGPLRNLRRNNTIQGMQKARPSRAGSIRSSLSGLTDPVSASSQEKSNAKGINASTVNASSNGNGPTRSNASSTSFFVVPKKKFAIVPWSNGNLSVHVECSIQRELYDRYATKNNTVHHGSGRGGSSDTEDNTNPWVAQTFASFRQVRPVVMPMNSSFFGSRIGFLSRQSSIGRQSSSISRQSSVLSRQSSIGRHPTLRNQIMATNGGGNANGAGTTNGNNGSNGSGNSNGSNNEVDFVEQLRAEQMSLGLGHFYAVVSLILPHQDTFDGKVTAGNAAAIAEAVTLMSLHDVFISEAKAMEFALVMPPLLLKNAILCVIPLTEWIPFEDVLDYGVQIQVSRDPRHLLKPQRSPNLGRGKGGRDSVEKSNNGDLGGSCSSDGSLISQIGTPTANSNAPMWQQEKHKAKKLHQFVCHRMGLKTDRERDKKDDHGFTPHTQFLLEEKIRSLDEYLQQNQPKARGGVFALGKFRQMKRFGSIMKARIASKKGGNDSDES